MTQASEATKKCQFCAETIKAEAVVCRFCGRPLAKTLPTGTVIHATPVATPVATPAPQVKNTGLSCSFLIGLLAVIGVITVCGFFAVSLLASDTPSTAEDDADMAFYMSQEFVKDKLKAPSTAEFPRRSDSDVTVTKLGSGKYSVIAWVDSENGFGAMIRTTYLATLHRVDADNWRLDSLIFEDD